MVSKMTLVVKKTTKVEAKPRIRWWKLKERCYCEKFREVGQTVRFGELPVDWEVVAEIVRWRKRQLVCHRVGEKTRGLGGGMGA